MGSWTGIVVATAAAAGASLAIACGSFGEAETPGDDAAAGAEGGGPAAPDGATGTGDAGQAQPCGATRCGVACLPGESLTTLLVKDLKERNAGPFLPMNEGPIEDALEDENDGTFVKDDSGGGLPEGLRFAKTQVDVGGKTIVRVAVVARARAATDLAGASIVVGIYNQDEDTTQGDRGFEGNWSSSTALTGLGGAYKNVSREWERFPWGELQWTAARLNPLQLMLSLHSATGNPVQVARAWLEVCSR